MIDAGFGPSPSGTRDGLLYHYTTQNGLLGILASNSIWATHAGHLNDASEFKRGLAIVRRHLDQFKFTPYSKEPENQVRSPNKAKLDDIMVEKFRAALRIVDEVDVFIASFFDSEAASTRSGERDAGDVLNQWRAYSQGGSGFSIGFDKALLSNHIARMESKSRLISSGSCNYDEKQQEKYLQERTAEFGSSIIGQLYSFIDDFLKERKLTLLQAVRGITGPPSEAELDKVAELASAESADFERDFLERMAAEFERIDRETITKLASLMRPLAFIKHPSFRSEEEWRIAQFDFRPTTFVKFRSGTSSLIPYVEVQLPLDDPDSNLIKRIVVGPSPKIEEAVQATKMRLRCKGYKLKENGSEGGIDVVPSELPFRSW